MIGSNARRLALAGASWLGVFAIGGCTLITDVDRSKIPSGNTTPPVQDSGTDAGGQEPVDSGAPTPTDTADSAPPDAAVETDSGTDEPADAAPPGDGG
jgi:hypothetical protein